MTRISKLRFAITYKNAGDDSFVGIIHKRLKSEAITEARVRVLLEYARYGLELKAEIKNELHPNDPPIVINLNEILKIARQ
jgi:hypothetical protein